MRTVSEDVANYLASRDGIIAEEFVYVFAKNRITGDIEAAGFSSLPFDVSIEVISGQTGEAETRGYVGTGALLDCDDMTYVSDLTVQTWSCRLSQINTAVRNALRGYEVRNQPIEFHRTLFNLDNLNPVDAPYPAFVGTINKQSIKRARIGSSGGIELKCRSRTGELTLINPAKKSDETQKLRSGDRFRKYNMVASLWSIFWGENK